MHHGQSRGKNTRKVCKKQVNLPKTGGEICKSRGKEKFSRNRGGKCTETAKIGGIRDLWSMTKKRSSEIFADENQEIFCNKFPESPKIFQK